MIDVGGMHSLFNSFAQINMHTPQPTSFALAAAAGKAGASSLATDALEPATKPRVNATLTQAVCVRVCEAKTKLHANHSASHPPVNVDGFAGFLSLLQNKIQGHGLRLVRMGL